MGKIQGRGRTGGEYRQVPITTWTDPMVLKAGPDTKLVWLYLLTSPHGNALGMYRCPVPYVASETGLAEDVVREAIDGPLAGWVTYDKETGEVLVAGVARREICATLSPKEKRYPMARRLWGNIHSDTLRAEFRRQNPGWPSLEGDAVEDQGAGPKLVPATDSEADEGVDYTMFELAWELYPQHQSQGKSTAKREWRARRAEEVEPDEIVYGVMRYAWWCLCSGTEPKFVKHASTFFGSNGEQPWRDEYGWEDPRLTFKMCDEFGEMIEWRRDMKNQGDNGEELIVPVKANEHAKPLLLEEVLTKHGHPPTKKAASE